MEQINIGDIIERISGLLHHTYKKINQLEDSQKVMEELNNNIEFAIKGYIAEIEFDRKFDRR